MKRRTLGVVALAAGAGAAGVMWRQRQEPVVASPPPAAPRSEAAASPSGAAEAANTTSLWIQTVERVDGSPWSLQSLQGEPVIVNFWATWCPPCIREMPMLDRFYQAQPKAAGQGRWRLVGLAVDRREAVARFLTENPVSYDIAIAGMDAIAWGRQLGNGSGGLPFTVAFGRQGQVLHQKLGEISEAELRAWLPPPL